MASQIPFEEHRKLLLSVAHNVHRRCYAAGARSVQFEDIYGELCVAWCLARDAWDAKYGVPFGPYLMRGMSHHINRWVKREIREYTIAPFNLDAEMESHNAKIDATHTLHDIVADESQPGPQEALEQKDMRDYARDPLRWRELCVRERLSPSAEKFLDLMENPPPALMMIINGLQARAEYGRTRLHLTATFAPKRVTRALVLDLMGVESRAERAAIYSQLDHLHNRVSQQ